MSEIGIHQGDDGFEDFQSLPFSDEREIDSDEEERSMEPQAEEDVRNSSGLRKRKMKSSRPDEDVRHPSELGNGKERSSRSGRELDGGVDRDLLQSFAVVVYVFLEVLSVLIAWEVIRLVLALFVVLCSRSFSGELYVNQHEVSKDLHQIISEMRIVETPLHSIRSVAQDGKWILKLARHDFLLLRTDGDKWYKAEKHGPSSGQAGIHFYPVTGPGVEVIRFRSSISVDFSLAQALAILTDHKLDYSLWGENCWKYAHSRAEGILNSCIEIASDDNVRNELKKELENLMDARRRMPNEVVDFVQDYNIIRGVLFCFTGVFGSFWLGSRMDLVRGHSLFHAVVAVCSMSFYVLVHGFMRNQNPILLTYSLTGLATTYRWPFRFLSFFGYFVGLIMFLRGVESWTWEVMMHSEEPDLVAAVHFFKTVFLERGDLDITNSRANYHQDNSMEDQRKKWPLWALTLGIRIVVWVIIFEKALGYSSVWPCSFLAWLASGGLHWVLHVRPTEIHLSQWLNAPRALKQFPPGSDLEVLLSPH